MVDQGLSSLADLRTTLEKKDDHCASFEDSDVRLAGFLNSPDFDSSGQFEAQV